MKQLDQLVITIGVVIFSIFSLPQAFATASVTLDHVSSGALLIKTDKPGHYTRSVTQNTDVAMQIRGPVARAVVTQTFLNPGDDWAEAIYAFPLPEDAAVDHLNMKIGDRVIEGQIKEKQQAKKIYTQAKRDGKRAALVEQHRPNLFTTSVANIPPAGKVVITIEYQQPLKWQDQRFSIRYPMAITPRYTPGSEQPATTRIESSAQLSNGWSILPGEIPNIVPLTPESEDHQAGNQVSLRITLDAGFPLSELTSRYHKVNIKKLGEGRRQIALEQEQVRADRDFVLEWIPQASHQPKGAFFTETTESGHYGLLMVMPPRSASQIPYTPRELIFVIDTSGSMGGESIRQA